MVLVTRLGEVEDRITLDHGMDLIVDRDPIEVLVLLLHYLGCHHDPRIRKARAREVHLLSLMEFVEEITTEMVPI